MTRLLEGATVDSVWDFIDEHGITYPIAEGSGALADHFNVKGIPAAAMVRDGQVVWRGHPARLTEELLEQLR